MSTQDKAISEVVNRYIRDGDFKPLKSFLYMLTVSDVIETLQELDKTEQTILFRLLAKDFAIEVFEKMDPSWQHDLIESFASNEVVSLLGSLEPDDRVHLLDEFPAKVAKRLLEQLPKDQRDITAHLMGYDKDTVGRIMSPMYVDVKKYMTVNQALEHIRSRKNAHDLVINNVYVTDETRKLEGVLPLSALVTASPDETIENLIRDRQFEAVSTDTDQEQAARMVQQLDAIEMPVLDKEDRLVGVLTVDDAMDVLSEEATDDMFDKVGLVDITTVETGRSYKLLNGNFFHVFIIRVPFLLITLAGGMLAGAVIDAFEDILAAVVATAIFIPVIMDMGGNVGTQSSTIFTRGLVLGQINMRRFLFHWGREVLFGLGMAIVLGTLGGLIAAFWQQMPALGLAVGISMTLTITLGIALGFLVPFVLIKMGFDQAAGADPIITTIKDMSGLAIYFTCVSLFLPEQIAAAA